LLQRGARHLSRIPQFVRRDAYHVLGHRRHVEQRMGSKESFLLAMVIFVPLVIAIVVTLWTLEQARLRNKKNRERPVENDLLDAKTPSPPPV